MGAGATACLVVTRWQGKILEWLTIKVSTIGCRGNGKERWSHAEQEKKVLDSRREKDAEDKIRILTMTAR